METFEGNGRLQRPPWWRNAIWIGPFESVIFLVHRIFPGPMALAVALAVATVLFLEWLNRFWFGPRNGVLRVDVRAVALDGKILFRRAQLRGALLLPSRDTVRLFPRHRLPLDVELESDAAAEDLLRALGFGSGQAAVPAPVAFIGAFGLFYYFLGLVIGLGLSATLGPHGYGRAAAPLVVAVVATLAMLPQFGRITVGSDGILIQRYLVGVRFISYADPLAVRFEGEQIVLVDRSGARTSFGNGHGNRDNRAALFARIEEARAAFALGNATEGAEVLVAPGGRPLDRWLRDLRALVGGHDYRDAALDATRLWRMVDDATAPAATRAGAAVALSPLLDGDGRTRLRIASDACAEPKLRVVLRRLSEGADDEEVEAVVSPLMQEKAKG